MCFQSFTHMRTRPVTSLHRPPPHSLHLCHLYLFSNRCSSPLGSPLVEYVDRSLGCNTEQDMQVTSLLCSGNPGGSVSHALIQCKPPPTQCSRPAAVTAENPPHAAGLPTQTTASLTGTVNTASCKASRPPTLPMANKSIAPLPPSSALCSQPSCRLASHFTEAARRRCQSLLEQPPTCRSCREERGPSSGTEGG